MVTILLITKVENMKNHDVIYKKKCKTSSSRIKNFLIITILVFICFVCFSSSEVAYATGINNNEFDSNLDVDGRLGPIDFQINSSDKSQGLPATLQIMIIITLIALAPSILIMVTSFTRILVVLHFVRSAIGTSTTPPNQVLIGIAVFLTFFIMSPTFVEINENAIEPLANGQITEEEAFDIGLKPIRNFMLGQTKEKDLRLFMDISEIGEVETIDDIPTTVVIPSFIISELKTAFVIGFLIYIPFLIIDMVVASTLMSMGMMMLPPTTISLPFKILLFIMADGWNLIIGELVRTFY